MNPISLLRRPRASRPNSAARASLRKTRLAAILFGFTALASLVHAQREYHSLFFSTIGGGPTYLGLVFPGDPQFSGGVAVDANNQAYAVEGISGAIWKFAPGGSATILPAFFPGPRGERIPALFSGYNTSIAVDAGGAVYIAAHRQVCKVAPDGNTTILAENFNAAQGLALDAGGNLYVSDSGSHTIHKISSAGAVTTLAGKWGERGASDGLGSARFNGPAGVGVDSSGTVFVADLGNRAVRKIAPDGTVSTLARLSGTPYGIAVDRFGTVYVGNAEGRSYAGYQISAISPGGVVTTLRPTGGYGGLVEAGFLTGIAVADNGTFYVTDGWYGALLASGSPPSFTTPLASQSVAPGDTATFSVTANGEAPIAYQWLKNGVAIPGATNATLTIGNLQASDVGSYSVRLANAVGTLVSNPALLSAQPPQFTAHPLGQTVAPGTTVVFSAAAANEVALTYQWCRDGVPIPGATDSSLSIDNVQASTLGVYTLTATNWAGSTTSHPATLSFATPTFTQQPVGEKVISGATVTFSAAATGSGPISYQWQKDGVNLAGATSSSLTVPDVQSGNLGIYTVVATDSMGSSLSHLASLSFIGSLADRVTAFSVRGRVDVGSSVLIAGFVLRGTDTTARTPLLLRGVGPALGHLGVPGALGDPKLSIYSGSTVVATNDNWNGDVQVSTTAAQVGAFAFASTTSRDAAIHHPGLEPGVYTALVSGAGDTRGVALAEIYDAISSSEAVSLPRLVGLSARAQVGGGADTLIAGFKIDGASAKHLLIRGVGPRLSIFGVTEALTDPKLELFQDGRSLRVNDNWSGDAFIASAAAKVGTFPLDRASRDAALFVTLQPGVYTVHLSGAANAAGIALLEIYEVP